ncbi:hemerythrin domain-containing protein [Cupriavidus pauculus]|uniref:UvrABC system protein A n=1 Tax=Cupriavidus pauculus TaxID=82633 RepID=A0A2N5CEP4_9BURK|nr:hemerythrin domain-containing protein [Cupriavidus pauculus]PLQ00703.1 hypothetical protein CYJ10_09605 [Cupriavidus pauculus]
MDKSKVPVEQRAALSLLVDDHRSVKKLFKAFEDAKADAEKQSIASETCQQLTIHAQIEEEIFYPALRGDSDKIDDMLDETTVEHDMRVVAQADWVIDIGPGAGDEGGRIVASGSPTIIATSTTSVTAAYLAAELG